MLASYFEDRLNAVLNHKFIIILEHSDDDTGEWDVGPHMISIPSKTFDRLELVYDPFERSLEIERMPVRAWLRNDPSGTFLIRVGQDLGAIKGQTNEIRDWRNGEKDLVAFDGIRISPGDIDGVVGVIFRRLNMMFDQGILKPVNTGQAY